VEIFRAPTVSQLAEFIKDTGRELYAAVPLAEKKDYYPMSSVQRRLYYINQLDRGSTSYNMPGVKHLAPGMDITGEKLANLLQWLIRRHESLRTSFLLVEEEPVQRVHDEVEFDIEYYDITGAPIELAESAIKNFIRPFDLSRAPLLRAGLIETGDQKQIVMLDIHHIITDGLSQRILMEEVLALHRGESLSPLKLQYKDHSQWQHKEKTKGGLTSQEKYWLEQFAGDIPVLNLPTDYERPEFQRFEGKQLRFEFNKEETSCLEKLCSEEGVTLYMVLLSLYAVLLSKISGQEDIVIGTPVSGRRHADLDPVIGMFVNTLPLRNRLLPEQTFRQFLRQTKQQTLNAFENQDYPFEDIVEKVINQRDLSRNPLFDIMFSLITSDLQLQEIYREQAPPAPDVYENQVSKFDFTLTAFNVNEVLFFQWDYNTRLFKLETTERFIGYFKEITTIVLKDKDIPCKDIKISHDLSNEALAVPGMEIDF
jgi:tyrocidine synthetase-3